MINLLFRLFKGTGFLLFILPVLSSAQKNTFHTPLSFVRKVDGVFTYKLKSYPQVIGVFHSYKTPRSINWRKTNTAFFQSLTDPKKSLLASIGLQAWQADSYELKKHPSHLQIFITGSYKTKEQKTIYFKEEHLFFANTSRQILFSSPLKWTLNSPSAHLFFKEAHKQMAANKDDSINSFSAQNATGTGNSPSWLDFFASHRGLFIPQALASHGSCNIDCSDPPEPSQAKTEPLDRYMCEVTMNSPECRDVSTRNARDCEKEESQSKSSTQTGTGYSIWDYFLGCANGIFNSLQEVLWFAGKALGWIWRFMTGNKVQAKKTREKATEYIQNVKLYLHAEYEKRHDREKEGPARAISAIKALGGTIGHTLLNMFKGLLTSRFKKFKCLNNLGKSSSLCHFITDTFMTTATFVPVLAAGNQVILNLKSASQMDKALASLNENLKTSPTISEQNFTRLAQVENRLNKPLTQKKKLALVQVDTLLEEATDNVSRGRSHSASRILKKAGFTKREIREILTTGNVTL